MNKLKGIFLIVLFLVTVEISSVMATESQNSFGMLVAPSVADSDMDYWYKTPSDSIPVIHNATQVFQNQKFDLLIFFHGYSVDENKIINVQYDVQIYDPDGKPTEDKGKDILAYRGPSGNPDVLLLNQQYLQIVFTEKYKLGDYLIKVTGYDKVSGKTCNSEASVTLKKFTLPEKFESRDKAVNWMEKRFYYQKPEPARAVRLFQAIVQPDSEWLNDNLHMLVYFQRIFSKNNYVFKHIAEVFESFTPSEQAAFTLLSSLCKDKVLYEYISKKEMTDLVRYAETLKEFTLPDLSGKIAYAQHLDMLWSEFLATGKYRPIRQIVSTLEFVKYKGTLDKFKSGDLEKTDENQQKAYYEAVYQSAIWSLISNCKQHPLVFKYCVYMYLNDELEKDIKDQLAIILHLVQKDMDNEHTAPEKENQKN